LEKTGIGTLPKRLAKGEIINIVEVGYNKGKVKINTFPEKYALFFKYFFKKMLNKKMIPPTCVTTVSKIKTMK
jgi:hypothetical protein